MSRHPTLHTSLDKMQRAAPYMGPMELPQFRTKLLEYAPNAVLLPKDHIMLCRAILLAHTHAVQRQDVTEAISTLHQYFDLAGVHYDCTEAHPGDDRFLTLAPCGPSCGEGLHTALQGDRIICLPKDAHVTASVQPLDWLAGAKAAEGGSAGRHQSALLSLGAAHARLGHVQVRRKSLLSERTAVLIAVTVLLFKMASHLCSGPPTGPA